MCYIRAAGIAVGRTDVSLYPDDEFPETYHLRLVLYLLDKVTPELVEDFETIDQEWTEAGWLKVRQVSVHYSPAPDDIDTYSIWLIDAEYNVKGEQAEAVRVK
jgi:hypothetical protein